MTTVQSRQPQGRPTGGQFAATDRSDAAISLDNPERELIEVRHEGVPFLRGHWAIGNTEEGGIFEGVELPSGKPTRTGLAAAAKVPGRSFHTAEPEIVEELVEEVDEEQERHNAMIAEAIARREMKEHREREKARVRTLLDGGATVESIIEDGSVALRLVNEVRAERNPAETQRRLRGHDFYPKDMHSWPAVGSTDGTPVEDKQVVAKYFGAAGDWWIVEADQSTGLAFGYAQLSGHPEGAEWGYVHLPELEALRYGPFVAAERDLHFEPGTFAATGPRR